MKCWLSSAAVAVFTEVEASTDPGLGLTMVVLANGLACPTPTAFRASVTANVTMLVKSLCSQVQLFALLLKPRPGHSRH